MIFFIGSGVSAPGRDGEDLSLGQCRILKKVNHFDAVLSLQMLLAEFF